MEQLGTVAAMGIVAYAFGLVWYHILGRPAASWLRTVGYPLVAIILGEGIWAHYLVAGPELMGVHAVVALFATFLAVSLDIAVESRGLPFRKWYVETVLTKGGETQRKSVKTDVPPKTDRLARPA